MILLNSHSHKFPRQTATNVTARWHVGIAFAKQSRRYNACPKRRHFINRHPVIYIHSHYFFHSTNSCICHEGKWMALGWKINPRRFLSPAHAFPLQFSHSLGPLAFAPRHRAMIADGSSIRSPINTIGSIVLAACYCTGCARNLTWNRRCYH